MSTSGGPLCEEPMMGVCFIVEEIKVKDGVEKLEEIKEDEPQQNEKSTVLGPLAG